MRYTTRELTVVRDLAKRYMEIALSDKQIRMRRRFKDTNDLKIVRPPLNMEEIPWHEMNLDGELDCLCEDPILREMEYRLRLSLFRNKYFKCDNYMNPFWEISKSYEKSGMGFGIDEVQLSVDQKNNIVSHQYKDVLEDESALEAYRDPIITPHPEIDAENVERYSEILGDSMPVELRGHILYYAPWDDIAELRGVEPILIDMYDRPEYLHEIIRLFTHAQSLVMDQMERYGLYEPASLELHCTPGDFTHETEYNPNFGICRDIWFRTMAQMFSAISPDAHYEFDVQYSAPLAARCAYTYYGCCEPLHDRIHILKHYPNLRKIGVSPWANEEICGEFIGGNYVFSRKPNPANVALSTDPEQIRREITETVKVCRKYGCPCDITLKDISTVSYKPQNLILAEAASAVLDEYYEEA